jgi:putative hydrolase of the HAD superfamily
MDESLAESPDKLNSGRAIVFDFGGVFLKTIDYTPRHRWDDRLHLPRGSVERIVHGSESWRQAQTGSITPDAYWADVGRQLNLTADDMTALAHEFYAGDQLDSELVDYAHHLRERGYRVALLSNDSAALRDKLRAFQMDDLFNPLVISAEIGVMKPNARAFQIVLDRLQYPAARVVFVDDMPANIEGATAVGIHGIHYTTLPALQRALEPLLKA